MKNKKKEIEEEIEEICEALFVHGKLTPDKSYDLPQGQLTIAMAKASILALFKSYALEVIGEDEDIKGGAEHIMTKKFPKGRTKLQKAVIADMKQRYLRDWLTYAVKRNGLRAELRKKLGVSCNQDCKSKDATGEVEEQRKKL